MLYRLPVVPDISITIAITINAKIGNKISEHQLPYTKYIFLVLSFFVSIFP